jgi:hypothetical protein
MKSTKLFNGLNGVDSNRELIEEIIAIAKEENNVDIIYRLSNLLNNNTDKKFHIEIEQFKEVPGLNKPRPKIGNYRIALDECGRLNKGWKFTNGTVIYVGDKPKTTSQKPQAISHKPKATSQKPKVVKKSSVGVATTQKTRGARVYTTKKPIVKPVIEPKDISQKAKAPIKPKTTTKKPKTNAPAQKKPTVQSNKKVTPAQKKNRVSFKNKVKPNASVRVDSNKDIKTASKGLPKNIKTSSSVIEVPLKSINIDKARFQNRNSLNETVLNQIVKNYSETKLDPVILWKDNDNKIYLLAGHHRLEATKRVGKTHIQAKFFSGKEADAIYFAKVESNANRSLETPQERAKIYRDMRIKGKSKKDILETAKEIEGKNAPYIINLSYLEPTGIVMQMLNSFDKNTDQATEKEITKIADWIGNARQNYDLTDAHETEMFQFLKDASLSARIRTKAEFLQKINAIAGGFDFDKNEILNLKKFKYKSDGEAKYEEEYSQIKNQIDTISLKKQDLTDRLKNPKNPQYINPTGKDYEDIILQMDKVMQNYNEDLKYYQKKLYDLMQEKGNYINAGSNQVALFGPKKTTNKTYAPALKQPATNSQNSLSSLMQKNATQEQRYYENGSVQLAKFLGNIEIKNKESVAITLTGEQGSGKTRFVFQLMNAFAKNYKVGHASFEEHPESSLYSSKVQEYINPSYFNNIDVLTDFSINGLTTLIKNNDVIVIDSFQKLQELQKGLELDKDFRKKYDGKLFIIIYQQTSNGSMRGGTKSQFDGDIILMIYKEEDFRKSFIYPNKNRYTSTPLNELKYNIFTKKLQ